MLRSLYNWTLSIAAHRRAAWGLAGISFAESSFFPIPPDVLLVPMVIANRQKAWYYAAVCTLASAIGGLFGYAIGALLYDTVGIWLVSLYGYEAKIEAFRQTYADWGVWIILIAGFTPIPYKLITIASGLAAYDIGLFLLLSVIGRGARFFLLAGLLYYYGEPIRSFIDKRLEILTLVVAVIGVAGFVIVRYAI